MSKRTITPLGDKVLIQLVEAESITAAGIVLPDSVDTDKGMKEGKVIATGPGDRENGEVTPVSVKEGDIVLFSWGDELKLDGEDYYLVSEGQIAAVVS